MSLCTVHFWKRNLAAILSIITSIFSMSASIFGEIGAYLTSNQPCGANLHAFLQYSNLIWAILCILNNKFSLLSIWHLHKVGGVQVHCIINAGVPCTSGHAPAEGIHSIRGWLVQCAGSWILLYTSQLALVHSIFSLSRPISHHINTDHE